MFVRVKLKGDVDVGVAPEFEIVMPPLTEHCT
jgi:hypothetical protein